MKINIKKEGHWWSWKETCDRCGELIYDENWKSSEAPDTDVDFCAHCLKHFLKNGIPYYKAKEMYKLREGKPC